MLVDSPQPLPSSSTPSSTSRLLSEHASTYLERGKHSLKGQETSRDVVLALTPLSTSLLYALGACLLDGSAIYGPSRDTSGHVLLRTTKSTADPSETLSGGQWPNAQQQLSNSDPSTSTRIPVEVEAASALLHCLHRLNNRRSAAAGFALDEVDHIALDHVVFRKYDHPELVAVLERYGVEIPDGIENSSSTVFIRWVGHLLLTATFVGESQAKMTRLIPQIISEPPLKKLEPLVSEKLSPPPASSTSPPSTATAFSPASSSQHSLTFPSLQSSEGSQRSVPEPSETSLSDVKSRASETTRARSPRRIPNELPASSPPKSSPTAFPRATSTLEHPHHLKPDNENSEACEATSSSSPSQFPRRRPRSKSSSSGLPTLSRFHLQSTSKHEHDEGENTPATPSESSHPPSPAMSTRSMFSAFPSRPHTLFHLSSLGESLGFFSSSSSSSSSASSSSGSASPVADPRGKSGSKFTIGPYGYEKKRQRFGARGRYDTLPSRKSPLAKEVLSYDEAKGVHSPFVVEAWYRNEDSKGKGKGKETVLEDEINNDNEIDNGLFAGRISTAHRTDSPRSPHHHQRTYSYSPKATRPRKDSGASARDILVSVQERFVPPTPDPLDLHSRPDSPSLSISESSASATLLDGESVHEYDRSIHTSPPSIPAPLTSPSQISEHPSGIFATIRRRAQSLTPVSLKLPSLFGGGDPPENQNEQSTRSDERDAGELLLDLRPATPTVVVISPSVSDGPFTKGVGMERDTSSNGHISSPIWSTSIEPRSPPRNHTIPAQSVKSPSSSPSSTQKLSLKPPSSTLPRNFNPSNSNSKSQPPTGVRGGAFPPLHPALAELEKSSRLLKATVRCAVCGDVGKDFPRCGKCGEAWCSRECRVESLRREKEEGRGAGKRHVCRSSSLDENGHDRKIGETRGGDLVVAS